MESFLGCVKKFFHTFVSDVALTLRKAFTYSGRARRREFWNFQLFQLIVLALILLINSFCDDYEVRRFFFYLYISAIIILFFPNLAVSVRRLHDVGLTGFWFWYLQTFGLPIIFITYVLDLDNSCNRAIDRIMHTGYVWLGWLLALIFWCVAAPIVLLFIFMYAGKREANEFGPDPKAEELKAAEPAPAE